MFHKYKAAKIAKKINKSYEKVFTVIRCKLSFIILRFALLTFFVILSVRFQKNNIFNLFVTTSIDVTKKIINESCPSHNGSKFIKAEGNGITEKI